MEEKLLSYLEREAEYNTFLTADIVNFGFSADFQKVYALMEGDEVHGVFLSFYQNLLVSGGTEEEGRKFLEEYINQKKPQIIMGKKEAVEPLSSLAGDGYIYKERPLYHLKETGNLELLPLPFQKGEPGDEEKIFPFLASIDEIKGLYRSKEMIRDRLCNQDGFHYYLEEDGRLIAHGNSAAIGPYCGMIGGLCVSPGYRNQGIGGKLASQIAKELVAMGRIPCLFSERAGERNLFARLGFEQIGVWATLERG